MHVCATTGGTEAVTGSSECVRVCTECTAEHQNTDRLGRRLLLVVVDVLLSEERNGGSSRREGLDLMEEEMGRFRGDAFILRIGLR